MSPSLFGDLPLPGDVVPGSLVFLWICINSSFPTIPKLRRSFLSTHGSKVILRRLELSKSQHTSKQSHYRSYSVTSVRWLLPSQGTRFAPSSTTLDQTFIFILIS